MELPDASPRRVWKPRLAGALLVGVASLAGGLAAKWLRPEIPPCLSLQGYGAKSENDRCVVSGNLRLEGYPQSRLPDRLTVRGDLRIEGHSITALPRSLEVAGDLVLYKTSITRFPPDLEVGGDVDLLLGLGDQLPLCKSVPSSVRIGGRLRCE